MPEFSNAKPHSRKAAKVLDIFTSHLASRAVVCIQSLTGVVRISPSERYVVASLPLCVEFPLKGCGLAGHGRRIDP